MIEKTVVLDGVTYVLRPLTYRQKTEIKNNLNVMQTGRDPVTGQPRQVEAVQIGTFQARTIFHSLSSWSIADEKGNPIPLTWDNFLDHFPQSHDDALFIEAMALSSLTPEQKKTSE